MQLLDDQAYHVMLYFLDNQHSLEKAADEGNLLFLKNDWWLADTAVIDTINYKKGGWEVYLTFANYKKPLQLIVRMITRCYEGKARTTLYAKTRRERPAGNTYSHLKDLNLCLNQ